MNFDMGKMQAMMEQARQMSEVAGEQLAKTTVEGSAGGGAVRVRMNGKKEVLGVTLDPAVLGALGNSNEDLQMLEDLLRAAFNDGGRRADEAASGSMAGMLGGLGLPDGL
jgi:DNA-binding YbaB/EbfC family protein